MRTTAAGGCRDDSAQDVILIDALASTALGACRLWTTDRPLAAVARRFDLAA